MLQAVHLVQISYRTMAIEVLNHCRSGTHGFPLHNCIPIAGIKYTL